MAELEMLERFEDQMSPPSEAVTSAARARLHRAMSDERTSHRPGRRRTRLRRVTLPVLAAAATVIGLVVAASVPRTHHPVSSGHVRDRVLVLESYHFTLPLGFAPRDAACSPPPSTSSPAETVLQAMESAASSDGGCLEATIAAGAAVVPEGAQPVAVGDYDGDVGVAPDGDVTLYVMIPAADGAHYLVMVSTGLTEQQIVDVAASGLPG